MIWESQPWRGELRKCALALHKAADQKRATEKRSFMAERALLVGAYVMRKLSDSKKLPDSCMKEPIKAWRYAPKRKIVHTIGSPDVFKDYDLTKSELCAITLRSFCNFVIHSHVLAEVRNLDEGILGFLINSDQTKDKFVYEFSLRDIALAFDATAAREPTKFIVERGVDAAGNPTTTLRVLDNAEAEEAEVTPQGG